MVTTSRSLHEPARILKVSVEALTEFSHVCHPDGLNNTSLSQVRIPEKGLAIRMSGRAYRGEGEELPMAQVQLTGQPVATSSL